MASGPTLTQFTFAAGIDESTRAEAVDPTAGFLVLENGRQTQRGAYEKRFGFTAQTLARLDSTTRSAGYKLIADGNTVGIIDGAQLDVYSSTLPINSPRGRVCEVGLRTTSLPNATPDSHAWDVEYCNGYLAILSVNSGTQYVSVIHEASKAVVVPPTAVGVVYGSYSVLTSFSSRYFVLFTRADSTSAITSYICDTSTAAGLTTGFASLATVVATSQGMSACSLEDRVAVVYGLSSGTDRVVVKTYNASGILETATVPTSSTTPDAVDIAGSNADGLWVAWNQGTSCNLKGLTGNSLSTVIATTATILNVATGTNNIRIAPKSGTTTGRYLANDTDTVLQMKARGWTISAGAASATGSTSTTYNLHMTARPFYQGSRVYVPILCGAFAPTSVGTIFAPAEGSLVLADITEDAATYLRPVSNVYPGLAGMMSGACKSVVGSDTSKRYIVASMLKNAIADHGGVTSAGVGLLLVEWDFASTQRWKTASHADSTFLSGGVLTYFDGAATSEAGFIPRPRTPVPTTSGTGVSLTNGRKYVAIYEDMDGDGNRTVSAISLPSSSTGAVTNKTITVTTSSLTISNRLPRGTVRVAFYATLDSANGQPPYYRLGSSANNPAGANATFADVYSDTVLSATSKLYAPNLTGGVGAPLERRAPGGMMHLVSYNGMLVGAIDSLLFHSGQTVYGEAPWFNPLFQIPVEGEGEITGLATLDGALVVFKRRGIYVLSGEAPSDSGTTGGLGTPRKLAVDFGCIDARGIVTTSLGTFFQSDRGIEILTRAQSVEWIGEAVQETVAAYPICTAATLDAPSNTVLFEMAATETANQVSGSGRTLVYDLAMKLWVSTDRRKNHAGTADTPAQSACVVYSGGAYRYAWLGTDGRVYVEDHTTYLDDSNWVTMRAQTAWVKLGGIQGTQFMNKVLFLAKQATQHDLNMYLGYDYSSSFKTVRTFTKTELATLTGVWPSEQLEHQLHTDAEGQAVTLKIEDATPTSGTVGTGQGATWIALTFEGTPRPGAARLPSSAR